MKWRELKNFFTRTTTVNYRVVGKTLADAPGHMAFGDGFLNNEPPSNVVVDWVLTPTLKEDPIIYPGPDSTVYDHFRYVEWYADKGRTMLDHVRWHSMKTDVRFKLRYPNNYVAWKNSMDLTVALLEEHVTELGELLRKSGASALSPRMAVNHNFWLAVRYEEIYPVGEDLRKDLQHLIARTTFPNFVWKVDENRKSRLLDQLNKQLKEKRLRFIRKYGPMEGTDRYQELLEKIDSVRLRHLEGRRAQREERKPGNPLPSRSRIASPNEGREDYLAVESNNPTENVYSLLSFEEEREGRPPLPGYENLAYDDEGPYLVVDIFDGEAAATAPGSGQ